MKSLGNHVANINCTLKEIKLDTFIYGDYHGLIITSHKVASLSDLEVVESYVKNTNSVDANNVQVLVFYNSSLT